MNVIEGAERLLSSDAVIMNHCVARRFGVKDVLRADPSGGRGPEIGLERLHHRTDDRQARDVDLLALGFQPDDQVLVFSEVGFRRRDADMQHSSEFNEALDRADFMFCGLNEPFRYGEYKQFAYFANALYANPNYNAKSRTDGDCGVEK
jgi:hypothetical protein